MITNFNEQIFRLTKDANVAIFVENLACWIKYNATKDNPQDRNFHEGRYWSYDAVTDLVKYYGAWSTRQIRVIIDNCIKLDLIQISTFNKKRYDNTNWYTLTDKALEYYPVLKGMFLNTLVISDKPLVKSDRPIPEELNTLGSNINITTSVSDETSNSKLIPSEVIKDVYNQHMPELTRIKTVDTDLNNKIKKMQKTWPKYQKEGKKFSIELFIDFMNFVRHKHSWFITPYVTPSGNARKNSLRNLISEKNLAKFANGEFSAN